MLPKKIALICGGPSPERGISLNSARSVMDHLMDIVDVVPFYVDLDKNFYQLDPALLYSNTPSDFDFKLSTAAVIPDKPEGRRSGTQGKLLDPGSAAIKNNGLVREDRSSCNFAEDDNGGRRSVKLSTEELIATLKTFDLVFPAIHGDFGETGELQAFLEKHQIPFVGCGSEACLNMYYKDRAAMVLKQAGFDTLPSVTVNPPVILGKLKDGSVFPGVTGSSAARVETVSTGIQEKVLDLGSAAIKSNGLVREDSLNIVLFSEDDVEVSVRNFFIKHKISRAIVKPIAGGSSIGVHSVTSAEQAIDIVSKATAPMIIEPFCEGREFTVIVLQSKQAVFPGVTGFSTARVETVSTGIQEKVLGFGSAPIKGNGLVRESGTPVALVPTEIQISYEDGAIFDYRRKYLPTSNTMWACPPSFPDVIIQKIRSDAEAIFRLFNMRDFARLDGWLLNDGRIVFTDMNPISGMEQNSFIFQQTSRMGLTHQEALLYVIGR